MWWKRWRVIPARIPAFFSQFTGQSAEIDSSSAGDEGCLCSDAVLLAVIHIYVILIRYRTKSLAGGYLMRTLAIF
jgi:hypothetical protein